MLQSVCFSQRSSLDIQICVFCPFYFYQLHMVLHTGIDRGIEKEKEGRIEK
jgi:hypothetical protein